MPISKNKFDSGRVSDPTETQVLAFLQNNRNNAFRISEIIEGLGLPTAIKNLVSIVRTLVPYWFIQNAPNALVREGKVNAKTVKQRIGEVVYYMAA